MVSRYGHTARALLGFLVSYRPLAALLFDLLCEPTRGLVATTRGPTTLACSWANARETWPVPISSPSIDSLFFLVQMPWNQRVSRRRGLDVILAQVLQPRGSVCRGCRSARDVPPGHGLPHVLRRLPAAPGAVPRGRIAVNTCTYPPTASRGRRAAALPLSIEPSKKILRLTGRTPAPS